MSHRGWEEFSYDFAMPVGSDVCASREGTVSWAVDGHDGNGVNAPNNAIAIRHDDGTQAWYLHIKRGGAAVKKGDQVKRGQRIGASGNVGPNLDDSKPSKELVVDRVTNGQGAMPAFKDSYSPEQIEAVADYVVASTRG